MWDEKQTGFKLEIEVKRKKSKAAQLKIINRYGKEKAHWFSLKNLCQIIECKPIFMQK